MSWMDLSDYLVIEEAAAARIHDLRDEAAAPETAAEVTAPLRAPLFTWNVPRRIDDVIDYFGDSPPPGRAPVRGCG